MPLVSIIIPTYNRAKLISRAIESIIAQTFTDWELIIVDDGSTDNTEQVVSRFVSSGNIRYQKKNNTGAAHTRNVGASLASGTWLTFLDSDDEAEPAWLFEMSNCLSDPEVGAACCGLVNLNQKGEIMFYKYPRRMSKIFHGITGRFTNGGIFIVRRDCFSAVGGYDPDLKSGQHTELAVRLISYLQEKKMRVATIDKPLIRIHVHDGERIRFNNRALYEGSTRFVTKHAGLLKADSDMLVDYLNSIAVSAVKLGLLEDAKRNSMKALLIKPLSWKQWARMLVINLKFLRTRYYH